MRAIPHFLYSVAPSPSIGGVVASHWFNHIKTHTVETAFTTWRVYTHGHAQCVVVMCCVMTRGGCVQVGELAGDVAEWVEGCCQALSRCAWFGSRGLHTSMFTNIQHLTSVGVEQLRHPNRRVVCPRLTLSPHSGFEVGGGVEMVVGMLCLMLGMCACVVA